MVRVWVGLALITLLVTPCSPAWANDAQREDEAEALFLVGRAELEAQHYEAALFNFQRSYTLSGRPELLYNIGVTAALLERPDMARRALERFLELDPNTTKASEVRARLATLPPENKERRPIAGLAAPLAAGPRSQRAAQPPQVQISASAEPAARPSRDESPRAEPLRRKWWLWTLVIGVAGGAVAGLVLGLRSRHDEPERVSSRSGVTIFALK